MGQYIDKKLTIHTSEICQSPYGPVLTLRCVADFDQTKDGLEAAVVDVPFGRLEQQCYRCYESTLEIGIPDMSGIQIVGICLIAKCSIIQITKWCYRSYNRNQVSE